MTQIVYTNGRYVAYSDAQTHVEDRGYQLADSVYEGIGYIDGDALDADGHYDRLEQSLDQLAIPMPMRIPALRLVVERILRANNISTGFVYIQVSRGIAPREHSAYYLDCAPVLVVMAKHQTLAYIRTIFRDGIAIGLMPDLRWQRCDIKTTGLLANCLAKTVANSSGYEDAWLVDENNHITEGTASNAWIVDQNGVLRTKALSSEILRGITRTKLLTMLDGVEFEESAFSIQEAINAREAFITSASLALRPVIAIDGQPIADGTRGTVTHLLQKRFMAHNGAHLPSLLGLE